MSPGSFPSGNDPSTVSPNVGSSPFLASRTDVSLLPALLPQPCSIYSHTRYNQLSPRNCVNASCTGIRTAKCGASLTVQCQLGDLEQWPYSEHPLSHLRTFQIISGLLQNRNFYHENNFVWHFHGNEKVVEIKRKNIWLYSENKCVNCTWCNKMKWHCAHCNQQERACVQVCL